MKKHSLKDWMIAVRPWSFPASSMPVVVTLALSVLDAAGHKLGERYLGIVEHHCVSRLPGIPGVIILTISIRSMQGIPLAPRP